MCVCVLQVCAVLAAVSEVVKAHDGTDSETEYFGALVSTYIALLVDSCCTYCSLPDDCTRELGG